MDVKGNYSPVRNTGIFDFTMNILMKATRIGRKYLVRGGNKLAKLYLQKCNRAWQLSQTETSQSMGSFPMLCLAYLL